MARGASFTASQPQSPSAQSLAASRSSTWASAAVRLARLPELRLGLLAAGLLATLVMVSFSSSSRDLLQDLGHDTTDLPGMTSNSAVAAVSQYYSPVMFTRIFVSSGSSRSSPATSDEAAATLTTPVTTPVLTGTAEPTAATPATSTTAQTTSTSTTNTQTATDQPASDGSWPTDKELLDAFKRANESLRIYIYDPPWHVYMKTMEKVTKDCMEHFMPEIFIPQYFGASGMRTANASEADFLLLPHHTSCLVNYWSTYKTTDMSHAMRLLLLWLVEQPSFQQRQGRDHILVHTYDQGPFWDGGKQLSTAFHANHTLMQAIRKMIIVSNNNVAGPDNVLFRPGWDIAIPQPGAMARWSDKRSSGHRFRPIPTLTAAAEADDHHQHTNHNERPRNHALFYRGGIFWKSPPGQHGGGMPYCSPWIRVYLDWTAKANVNRGQDKGPLFMGNGTIGDASFGLAPAGNGCWSYRLYDAIYSLTVPIIIGDGVILPFERFLDWRRFSAKVLSRDLFNASTVHDAVHTYMRTTKKTSVDGNAISSWIMKVDPTLLPMKMLFKNWTSAFETIVVQPAQQRHYNNTDYLVTKRKEMARVAEWFQWNTDGQSHERSAFHLLVIELWCRTKRGEADPICLRSTSTLAYETYW